MFFGRSATRSFDARSRSAAAVKAGLPPVPNPPRTATDNGDGTVTFTGITAINLTVTNNDDGTATFEGLQ